jgi:hypothetical protein
MKAIALLTALFLCGCGDKPPGGSKAGVGGVAVVPSPRQGPSQAPVDAGIGIAPAGFGGIATHAATVVYVVDCSGSMMHVFDDLRRDVLASVERLDPKRQSFHVILFSDGPPAELAGANARATSIRKKAAAEFLCEACTAGDTDPLPALARAFDVLDAAPAGPKTIVLLTDSGFPDHQEVLRLCRARNAAGGVHVCTVVYPSWVCRCEEAMKKVAHDNGGECWAARAEE